MNLFDLIHWDTFKEDMKFPLGGIESTMHFPRRAKNLRINTEE